MAVVWGEEARAVGLADLDSRIGRLLSTIEEAPNTEPEQTPSQELTLTPSVDADPAIAALERRVEACVAVQRQQAEALRVEFAAQRADLRRWLNEGLDSLSARMDAAVTRDQEAAAPLLASTNKGLAECREDLAGIVAAVRSVSIDQHAQTEAIATAAATANLQLRDELEQHLAKVRFELERRIDRIERGVMRRSERQRRLLLTVAAGLGLAQVLGVVTVLAFG